MIALLTSWLTSKLARPVAAAFTFLTTKPGVYVLMVGLAAGAYWYSGHEGYKRAQADDAAAYAVQMAQAEAQAAKEARENQAQADKGIAAAAEHAGFMRGKSQARTLTITKEIPVYVPVKTDRTFPIPCGLYRVFRAAEDRGADPATVHLPPGFADGDACPLTASDLAANFVAVAGQYYDLEAQVIGLQDLAKSLKSAAEK